MQDHLLPKFEIPKIDSPQPKSKERKRLSRTIILAILISSIFGFLAGVISGSYFYSDIKDYLQKLNIKWPEFQTTEEEYIPQTFQEEAIIQVVKDTSPAVVSIIVTKELPILEEYYIRPFEEFPFEIPQFRQRIEKREIGGGSGFIITEGGMVLTNRHVVSDREADYTVLTNDGRKFSAEILARDLVQDLAIIKIEGKSFSTVQLGDSENLQIGQTVVVIGNALGEFKNTVSVGVVSGLGRTITASGGGIVEVLEDVIQTDAAINKGNSGGPLLNLKGEVIGINTAMAYGAENIGFAIPINKAKRAIEQVKTFGKIVYPFLGVCWTAVDEEVQKDLDLPIDYGALIQYGECCDAAIYPGSAAEKAGLREGDIILEFNNEKITTENSIGKIIMRYNPGDEVVLKIMREGKEKIVEATLGERSE